MYFKKTKPLNMSLWLWN